MIEKKHREQPRDILKRKMDADRLLKRVEKGLQIFLEPPFIDKKN
jgi:hypothetical protein|tara:strand:+ start:1613 stop:1747 length:135 start_codon:yes stop_codon:yes gene_type:complete